MLSLCWLNNGEKTPFTDEPQYPRIFLPKQIFLIFFFFYGESGSKKLSLVTVVSQLECRNVEVICKNLVPVEQVVSGHHAQEACWISD